MDSLFGIALLIVGGLFIGWMLGISGWRQARRATAEIARLRAALHAAGIPIPDSASLETQRASEIAPKLVVAEPTSATRPGPPGTAIDLPDAPPGPPPGPPPAPQPSRPGLEELLTLRWGTWLGAAVLLLAGVFLLRTAIEEGWLGPEARCALATLLALALIGGAEWLRRRPLPDRPNLPWPDQAPAALAAGGVALLFGAAYATAVLYALVPPLIGFVLMAAAALIGIALALLQGPLVAAVGIASAYVTPALYQSDTPWLPGLFAYLLVVTAAALAVVRQVGAAWLGWVATLAAAAWIVVGGVVAQGTAGLWSPALFVPVAAALHLALLPGAALEGAVGRRLAWIPFAVLAFAGLLLVGNAAILAPATALLLLTPVAVVKGAFEPRLNRLPWLAALIGLLLLLIWPIGAWVSGAEPVTVEGVVLAILPAQAWAPEALHPFLIAGVTLAAMQAASGLWMERRAPHATRWAALPAAVPVLVLLVAYARIRGFALDAGWAAVALALSATLVGTAALARREASVQRAGVHAAGAVAALALGAAMLLSDQWLTLAVALFLPPLAWIEARADLPALRKVAIAVAAVVLARLLLNPEVASYAFGTMPILNGLLPAYGVPAAAFTIAGAMFRRRGDDLAVALLEAGAIAFSTALLMLEIRHAATGGTFSDALTDTSFREQAWQVAGLSVMSTLLLLANRRLGDRPVLRWGWRLHLSAAIALGVLLLLANPAFDAEAMVLRMPVLNELLLAYTLPALLAGLAMRAPEAGWMPGFRTALGAYAVVAVFAWVTLEVRHLFNPKTMALALADPGEPELYAYTGAWLLLAGCLLALGIRQRIPALRLAALTVMAVTVGKAFVIDMSSLVGLWRALSFFGLGLALIALAWVYRRFVVVAPRV
ncbi:DUF2339 domain-containing protein [Plastoroseomonas arctica]|uniref:DUF2339 domain-containing protein n=1 Tax=Plastoroseomonas arctica TaxID=1509237 RepID=A0AAF1K421_9PROT|nr:DUF2339 domain-containing protein [Plastoroseomonas arctica]MBR0655490.1 DUF2339 domain-containing protein [Plastoroseomonas arctica]